MAEQEGKKLMYWNKKRLTEGRNQCNEIANGHLKFCLTVITNKIQVKKRNEFFRLKDSYGRKFEAKC